LARDEAVVRGREWERMEQAVDEKAWGGCLKAGLGNMGVEVRCRNMTGQERPMGKEVPVVERQLSRFCLLSWDCEDGST
jgi:hypothetical protein